MSVSGHNKRLGIRAALTTVICIGGLYLFFKLFFWDRIPRGQDDTGWAHVALFLSSFVPALLLLFTHSAPSQPIRSPRNTFLKGYWLLLIPLLSNGFFLPGIADFFHSFTYDISHGDVIPQIQIMVRRFLAGERPNAPIEDFGYVIYSPYLPFHWGPFIFAEWLGCDPRWVGVGAWIAAAVVFVEILRQSRINLVAAVGLSLLPGIFLGTLLVFQPVTLGATVELLICAYYLLLTSLFLLPASSWMGWPFVLLSRYSAIMYGLAWFRGTWESQGWQKALLMGGAIAAVVAGCFVIPFWIPYPELLTNGLNYHGEVTEIRWTNDYFQGLNGKPELLYEGTGLTRFILETKPDDRLGRLQLSQHIHLIVSIFAGVLLTLFSSKKRWQHPGFRVGGLLLCLSLFYHLLPLPIDYYFNVLGCVLIGAVAAAFLEEAADDHAQPSPEARQPSP